MAYCVPSLSKRLVLVRQASLSSINPNLTDLQLYPTDHPPSHLCPDLSLPIHVLNSLPHNQSCFPIHPPPSPDPSSNTILLPLGNTAHLTAVEIGTAAVILACFFWLVKVAWNTAGRLDAKRSGKGNFKRE